MNKFILLISTLLIVCPLFGQEDSIAPIRDLDNIYTATAKTSNLVIDLANPDDVEFALKKIHTFKYIESITFEGEGNENDLKKLLFRISVLKSLTKITFKENQLDKIPDNIAQIKTLQSLTIEANNTLDYNDLFMGLKKTQVSEIELIDNGLKKIPENISEMSSLRKIKISDNDEMDYTDLVERLAKVPGLNTLSIPLNYITDLPKNIGKLNSLQVLDVSNNNLNELPGEISSLKTINKISIQGNLLLDPVKDLEKLKGSNLQYLSLDKEIGGAELEQIKKMFPNIHIDFPISPEEQEEPVVTKPQETKTIFNGTLNAKKDVTILSAAYLLYPVLYQSMQYNFDTLRFDERYLNKNYENGARRINNGIRRNRCLYLRNYATRLEKSGKKDEIWFRFALNDARVSNNFPELRAFPGMYWVYKGELSKNQFERKFLIKRQRAQSTTSPTRQTLFKKKKCIFWNDVRIDFDKNNSLFIITLKCDTGFISFQAYPVIPEIPLEKSQEVYYRRFLQYRSVLLRRQQRFNRSWVRSKYYYDLGYKKGVAAAWKELQLRMSNEEKAMSKEEWLSYYDAIIANEKKALDNSALNPTYIGRSLTLRGFTISLPVTQPGDMAVMPTTAGVKNVMVDLIDKDGNKLAATSIFTIDNKNRTAALTYANLGWAANPITMKQYAGYSLLVELRNGNWGWVSAAELDKQAYEPGKTYTLKTTVLDKNLDVIGDLLKDALK